MDATNELAADIDAWVETTIAAQHGDGCPDFWDELNTSERLAEWLTAHGWRKE